MDSIGNEQFDVPDCEAVFEVERYELEDINYFFGYTNIPEKENKVQIFDYGTEHKKESLEKIEGYLKANKAAMEWCVKDTESLKKVQYHVNKPEDLIKIERPYYPGKLRYSN